MRRKAAASVVALGSFVVPASAQQTIIYSDPIYQPPGQVYQQPQPGFGNPPVYANPNQPQQPFGQQLPQPNFGQQAPQPNFGQPLPQPNFGQQPQPNIGQQPRPNDFGQQQPSFGQPLVQPQPNYGQPLPQPQQPFGQQPTRPIGNAPQAAIPQPPEGNVPYYDRASDTPPPTPPAEPREPQQQSTGPTVSPAIQLDRPEAPAGFDGPAMASGAADRGPSMSAELSDLIQVGERYRAASPGFLEDLKSLAAKYRDPLPQTAAPSVVDPLATDPAGLDPDSGPGDFDVSSSDPAIDGDPLIDGSAATDPAVGPIDQPTNGSNATFDSSGAIGAPVARLDEGSIATVVFLEDYFDDGEIEYNPPWRVRQGNWGIDPIYGLRAKAPEEVSDEPIKPKELLNVLLTGDAPDDDRASKPQAALIESQASIGNAFSFATRIVDHEGKGAAHFIMHQGGSDWLGYRLELRSGPQPIAVLTRRGSNGYKDITKVAIPSFKQGKTHELRWARLSDGQMLVILDGRPIITSRDTVFREDWTGFAFFNAGGDFSMRAIRVASPVER